jgi:dipeptidase D
LQTELIGANTTFSGGYPGWAPQPDADLLKHCKTIFEQSTGQSAGIKVIHAGLECGILGDKIQGLEMISFGPDIRGAHAPGERVELESVEYCWTYLKTLVAQLSNLSET